MNKMVKLYNKGKRTVQGVHTDEDSGQTKAYAFRPETSMAFHPSEAAKLKRLFPREMIDMESVTRDFDEKSRESDEKGKMISAEAAEREKKEAIEKAVSEQVAKALAVNNEKHEAARVAAEEKAKEEIKAAEELLNEKTPATKEPVVSDDDKFSKMNTVGKILGGKNSK